MRELADRLGWTTKKVNTTIDYICRELYDAGIPDFKPEHGARSVSRRIILAKYAAQMIGAFPSWRRRV